MKNFYDIRNTSKELTTSLPRVLFEMLAFSLDVSPEDMPPWKALAVEFTTFVPSLDEIERNPLTDCLAFELIRIACLANEIRPTHKSTFKLRYEIGGGGELWLPEQKLYNMRISVAISRLSSPLKEKMVSLFIPYFFLPEKVLREIQKKDGNL
jgi:hypothetical protein